MAESPLHVPLPPAKSSVRLPAMAFTSNMRGNCRPSIRSCERHIQDLLPSPWCVCPIHIPPKWRGGDRGALSLCKSYFSTLEAADLMKPQTRLTRALRSRFCKPIHCHSRTIPLSCSVGGSMHICICTGTDRCRCKVAILEDTNT